jgi:MFS family permease
MNFSTLMSSRFFAPLFWTQFLGAFNDNVYKNALVLFISVAATKFTTISPNILIPLSGGIFILPFFLFSALAGQLADKYEKSMLIRLVKIAEINVMILAALGFYFQNIYFLLSVLFLMGTQSALFGPVKYSILPQHLSEEGLLKGNGIIEMGTFLAILLGTLVGGVLILAEDYGRYYVSGLVVMLAVLGWLSSLKIPIAESANKSLTINWNIFTETINIILTSTRNRLIFGTIIGISWFWFIGATLLNILPLPDFIQGTLHAREQVITLILTLFSVGIGIGSIAAGRSKTLRKGIKWVVIGAFGITLVALDMYLTSIRLQEWLSSQPSMPLHGWQDMFRHILTLHILLDVLLMGITGGLYIVPLYVILQEHSEIKSRSRTIAANNISNALFMVISTILTMSLLSIDYKPHQLFLLISITNTIIVGILFIRFNKDVKRVLGI